MALHTGTGILMGLLACKFNCLFGWKRRVFAMRVRAAALKACWRIMLDARKRVDCIVSVVVVGGVESESVS